MSQGNNDFDQYAERVRDIFSGGRKGGSGRPNGGGGGSNGPNDPRKIIFGVIAFLAVLTGLKAFYTVEADEEGVVTRFGAYQHTSQPGLHFKIPWVDKVYKVKSKRRQEEVFGYITGSRMPVTEESLMLTGDLNNLHLYRNAG